MKTPKSRPFSLYYTAVALLLWLLTLLTEQWLAKALLLWSATSVSLVASAYLFKQPQIFRKNHDGRIPGVIVWLFWPFLTAANLYNRFVRLRDKTPAVQEIKPGLFLARRLTPSDLETLKSLKISAILDATSEFDALHWSAEQADMAYLNVPVLDHQSPKPNDVLHAVNWIHGQRASNKNVVIHCALGRGRSVFLLAAYLLMLDKDKTVRDVLNEINAIRKTAGLNMAQLRSLENIHSSKKVTLYPNAWIIANPVSGGGKWPEHRKEICETLGKYYALSVLTTSEEVDGQQLAKHAIESGADVIIAAGGDGTVNEVAAALRHTKIKMGIIPLGTTNALSHALWGIKAKALPVKTACETIIQGHAEAFDIGLCNEELFTLVLGIGFESRMIELANRETKNQSGQLAYLNGLFHAVSENELHKFQANFDGQGWQEMETNSLVIANSAPVFTLLAQGGGEPDARDGKLDITWLDKENSDDIVTGMLQLLLSEFNQPDNRKFQHQHVKRLQIKSESPITYSIDGEIRKAAELDISVQEKQLNILTNPSPR